MTARLLSFILAVSLTSACTPVTEADCTGLVLSDAWIQEPPPGPNVTAAYLRIRNPGSTPIVISGFDAPGLGRVELHETRQQGSNLTMHALESLTLAPHTEVDLSPGGKHLMLFFSASETAPRQGMHAAMTLHCGATSQAFTAEVRPVKTATPHPSEHHGHH